MYNCRCAYDYDCGCAIPNNPSLGTIFSTHLYLLNPSHHKFFIIKAPYIIDIGAPLTPFGSIIPGFSKAFYPYNGFRNDRSLYEVSLKRILSDPVLRTLYYADHQRRCLNPEYLVPEETAPHNMPAHSLSLKRKEPTPTTAEQRHRSRYMRFR